MRKEQSSIKRESTKNRRGRRGDREGGEGKGEVEGSVGNEEDEKEGKGGVREEECGEGAERRSESDRTDCVSHSGGNFSLSSHAGQTESP